MGYYFISYIHSAGDITLGNAAINEHPMDWQMDSEKLNPGEYVLISWREITMEEYNKFKGEEH